jgi:hypothetical protein
LEVGLSCRFLIMLSLLFFSVFFGLDGSFLSSLLLMFGDFFLDVVLSLYSGYFTLAVFQKLSLKFSLL